YSEFYADERTQQIFLEGMSASSLTAARSLAAQFPWSRYRTFIDIGTAQGCVPVEIARAHPHLRGGGFDLPEIRPAFTSYVASHQLSDRLTFRDHRRLTGNLEGRFEHRSNLQAANIFR